MDYSKLSDSELKILKSELESKISKSNNEQMALKILMNGEYGALGNVYFRYYDIRLASAVTLSGQLAIKWIEKFLLDHKLQEKYKWESVYCDTDSIYLDLSFMAKVFSKKYKTDDKNFIAEKINVFCEKVLEPLIEKGYGGLAKYVNANENRMFMKREKISIKGLWKEKKKYALMALYDESVIYPEPKLKVTGMETVSAKTPKPVRENLSEVLKLLMVDQTKLSQIIADFREAFFKLQPEEIAFSVGVNKLTKYETLVKDIDGNTELGYKKGCPIGVRAAITYNSYIIKNDLFNSYPEIQVGEKIKYVYAKVPNPFGNENVIGFINRLPNKEGLIEYIDYKTQFEKTFLTPIENITKKIKVVLSDATEVDIDDLF